jgi:pyruvate/2-oxoglutarate/acetoin dehydrogenase E1 component
MESLAADPLVRFVGYGVRIGGRAQGTLKNVPDSQLIEMPVAENLMVGFAIGLALKGLKPVVFIERFDFILNALDAIVNHLDKIETISRGEFKPAMILRIVVGNKSKPLFTGETHTQDFTMRSTASGFVPGWNLDFSRWANRPRQIQIEYRDVYKEAHVRLHRKVGYNPPRSSNTRT